MISIEDVNQDAYLNSFGGITTVRSALTMARINVHLGNVSEGKQFAAAGLANLGGATLLRGEFENILAMV